MGDAPVPPQIYFDLECALKDGATKQLDGIVATARGTGVKYLGI